MQNCTSNSTGFYYPPQSISLSIAENIALSWVAPNSGHFPITGYQITKKINGNFNSNNTQITSTNYTDLAATGGNNTYAYSIKSMGNSGFSPASCEVDILAPVAPTAPTTLSADGAGGNNVILHWDYIPANQIWDFVSVERADAGQNNWSEITTVNDTNYSNGGGYTDYDVVNMNTYDYRVRAHSVFNNYGYSSYSSIATATVT